MIINRREKNMKFGYFDDENRELLKSPVNSGEEVVCYEAGRLCYNDNEIKQAIITSGCVVAAYNVYDNWYRTGSDGKVGNNYGKNYGGHCILIVGWTENNEWIILNSWGRTWGDGGLGYVPMTTKINEAWCLVDNVQEIFFKSLNFVLRDMGSH